MQRQTQTLGVWLLRKNQCVYKRQETNMKQKQFDFEKFRQEQQEKKAAQKANNERVSEHKLLQAKLQLAKEEKARLNAMLNLSQVKHLIQLLLRRRTLMAGDYDNMHIRLSANTNAINRLTNDLAALLGVTDPSEKLDSDPEEEVGMDCQ